MLMPALSRIPLLENLKSGYISLLLQPLHAAFGRMTSKVD